MTGNAYEHQHACQADESEADRYQSWPTAFKLGLPGSQIGERMILRTAENEIGLSQVHCGLIEVWSCVDSSCSVEPVGVSRSNG